MKITTLFRSMALACAAIGTSASAIAAEGITLNRSLKAFYEDATSSSVGSYYVVLSDSETAYYDSDEFVVKMTGAGYAMALDLYAGVSTTKPIAFPAGQYMQGDGTKSMTYMSDNTWLWKYDDKGTLSGEYSFSGPVEVEVSESGAYTISATAMVDGVATSVNFSGAVAFYDPSHSYVWPQISENLDVEFSDAHAVYDGNLWESNTGEFYLYLYNDLAKRIDYEGGKTEFDMTTPGAMCYGILLFNRLFADDKPPVVEAAVYTPSRSMKRSTYYPGMEVDYMGMSVPLGFYAKKRVPNAGVDTNMANSYVEKGEVSITIDDDGNYDITVDCISTLGHTIKGTYHGPITVSDERVNHKPKASISTLEEDVECDLEQIEVARLQYAGKAGGAVECHQLVLDIGSPKAGVDQALLDNGGDIMRFWLLQSLDQPYLLEGTYTVIEEKYETFYTPFGVAWGMWSTTALGSLSGTRYEHFIPGSYMVMDHHAPIVSGVVSVVKNEDETYTIKFNMQDDAQFYISGEWTGPVEYNYDPEQYVEETGIDNVGADASEVAVERIGANRYFVRNCPADAAVRVYSVAGAVMPVTMSAEGILDMGSLNSGVYVVSVANRSFKVMR